MSFRSLYPYVAALAMMAGANPTMYGDKGSQKPKIKKCSECPEFGGRCKTKNGEMKPCSRYR